MSDGVPILTSADPAALRAATDEVSYSGESAYVQLVRHVWVSGAEGSRTVVALAAPTVTLAHTAPVATAASGVLLAANPLRTYGLLQNIGTVAVDITFGAAAAVSQGIRLQANGGSYEFSQAMGNLDTAIINGITATGTASVLVTEGA